ncbi:MAG: helix-turn-helix domain-containing protein [Solirubrobacteraceae bacterium]|nr:helix-turn-helix domain-containing protein [Solirubrobacteraceae bacterium]
MASATQDLQALAHQGRLRLDGIVDDLMERQRREVPEFFVTDDPAYVAAIRRSTHENSELMLDAIGRVGHVPRALGSGPRLEANLAAQHGASVDALLRTYRLGQHAMFEHVLDDIATGAYDDLARPTEALRGVTHRLYEYMEAVMPLVAREFADERERLSDSPHLQELRRVQAVLAGQPPLGLDYPTDATHVAVVATGPALAPLRSVAEALGVPLLAVTSTSDRWWAWMPAEAADEVATRLRREGLDGPAGIGGPCPGVGGFRLAHRQAQVAWQVSTARGGGVVVVRDAALEALALGDQDLARELVRAELGGLAANDERSLRLRGTLSAWFSEHESVAATAATLRVAPRTVTYRLRRAESMLGYAIADRRAELETALRLQRLFEAST